MAGPPPAAPKKAGTGCQVRELFELLGEAHVLDLLYLFLSEPRPRRFVEVQNALKISPNTLSDRLRGLVKAGLLVRRAYSEIPPRVEYEATPKAIEFDEVFRSLSEWARRNDLKPLVTATA